MRVGIVGYSAQKFDERKARVLVRRAIYIAWDGLGKLTIVSGYTNLGIPKLAYEYAQD
jgi:hypothetical protein